MIIFLCNSNVNTDCFLCILFTSFTTAKSYYTWLRTFSGTLYMLLLFTMMLYADKQIYCIICQSSSRQWLHWSSNKYRYKISLCRSVTCFPDFLLGVTLSSLHIIYRHNVLFLVAGTRWTIIVFFILGERRKIMISSLEIPLIFLISYSLLPTLDNSIV